MSSASPWQLNSRIDTQTFVERGKQYVPCKEVSPRLLISWIDTQYSLYIYWPCLRQVLDDWIQGLIPRHQLNSRSTYAATELNHLIVTKLPTAIQGNVDTYAITLTAKILKLTTKMHLINTIDHIWKNKKAIICFFWTISPAPGTEKFNLLSACVQPS